jgi:hypothetical protein
MVDFVIIAVVCLLIPVVVYALFAAGSYFGIQWYVTAVSILLVGRFLMGLLARISFLIHNSETSERDNRQCL